MVNPVSPRERFVLLGASNAAAGFPTIVELARQRAGEPLEIMAATALGRSFGKKSWIFSRGLLGILDCQLWRDLESRPALPTRALVSDIGNDILYDEPVERIADWVATCVQRLRHTGAQVALTQLPVANLPALGAVRFALFRRLFFPRCRLSHAVVCQRAIELNERLLEIAKHHEIQAISHLPGWYGPDPVHFRRRHLRSAWSEFLKPLFANQSNSQSTLAALPTAAYLYALAPAERWLFGAQRRRTQPAGRLRDGTTISVY